MVKAESFYSLSAIEEAILSWFPLWVWNRAETHVFFKDQILLRSPDVLHVLDSILNISTSHKPSHVAQ